MDANAMLKLVQSVAGAVAAVVYIIGRSKVAGASGVKPGYKTTGFWVTTLLNLPAVLQQVGILR